MKAFMFVEAEVGKTGNVVEAVQRLEGVKSKPQPSSASSSKK